MCVEGLREVCSSDAGPSDFCSSIALSRLTLSFLDALGYYFPLFLAF